MNPHTRRTIAQHLTAITAVLIFIALMGLVGAMETTGY